MKGGKLVQVLTLENDGEVDWPQDFSLFLTHKGKGITVLEEIHIGKVSPSMKKYVNIELFAFSICKDVESLEFELRHNQGNHTVGSAIKMQFKMATPDSSSSSYSN